MTAFKYVVYQEGKYYVSQCLNVDVASFGKTIDEAVKNLADAVELYLRDDLPSAPLLFSGSPVLHGMPLSETMSV